MKLNFFFQRKIVSISECINLNIYHVFENESFEMPLLKDIESKEYSSIFPYIANVPSYNTYSLKEGKCILGDERIFTKEGFVLKEITSQSDVPTHKKDIFSFLSCKRIPGKVLTLSLSGLENNYYHFNVEFLGRYFIFVNSMLEYDKIIFPRNTKFQIDFIDLLGINQHKIIDLPEGTAIIADELIFTDLINNWSIHEYKKGYKSYVKQYCPKWFSRMYKELLLNRRKIQNSCNKIYKKVYISRQKARYRRIVNEHELVSLLKKYDFSILYLEDLNVEEQINIFRYVEIVIAPHGAGLVNISYSQNLVKVLEIFSEHYHDPSFRIQALIMGHEYYFCVGKTTDIKYSPPHQENIFVDPSIIERWIKAITS